MDIPELEGIGVATYSEKPTKRWIADAIHAQKIIQTLKPKGYEIEEAVTSAARQSINNKARYKKDKTKFSMDIPELLPEFTVLAHQWVPIEYAVKQNKVLNADSQGLGKTFVSLISVLLTKQTRTVVICPSSLTENWEK
jgi:SNF2 family DNA or RNA helicase